VTEASTLVSVDTECPRTSLTTLVVHVITVVRMTNPLTSMAAPQPIPALPHAAAFRRLIKVLGRPGLDLGRVRMILTGQAKRVARDSHLLRPLYDLTPELAVLGQVAEVTDDVESHLGARQSHADAVFVLEKSDARLVVAAAATAYDRQENDVVFFALIAEILRL